MPAAGTTSDDFPPPLTLQMNFVLPLSNRNGPVGTTSDDELLDALADTASSDSLSSSLAGTADELSSDSAPADTASSSSRSYAPLIDPINILPARQAN